MHLMGAAGRQGLASWICDQQDMPVADHPARCDEKWESIITFLYRCQPEREASLQQCLESTSEALLAPYSRLSWPPSNRNSFSFASDRDIIDLVIQQSILLRTRAAK